MTLTPRKLFFILLLASPGFWWLVFQPARAASELMAFPKFVQANIHSPDRAAYNQYLIEMRWGGAALHRNTVMARIMYHRLGQIPKEVFDYLTFLSPRIYFVTGDSTSFTPPAVEPIASVFFPFWLAGAGFLFGNRRFKPLLLALLFAALAYLAGRKNLVYLFPVFLVYLYSTGIGLHLFLSRYKHPLLLAGLFLYSLYLLDRALWLRPLI